MGSLSVSAPPLSTPRSTGNTVANPLRERYAEVLLNPSIPMMRRVQRLIDRFGS
jgi:hypothetical protein